MRTFDLNYLRALSQQNRQAENDLISFFTKPVMMKLRARLRSPQAVEDAYQETLLRVFTYFRSGKMLRTPASLPAFVNAICRNVIFEMGRARMREMQIFAPGPDPIDAKPNAECEIISRERGQTVRQILTRVSEKDRKLLEKLFLDDEDRDKICKDFKITREYLRLLLYRARMRFRGLLEGKPGKEDARYRA